MDNLAKNAMLAKQAGMSYGKWKAMQPIKKSRHDGIPDGWKVCEYCGKAFKPISRKRFCDVYCRERAYQERQQKERAEK